MGINHLSDETAKNVLEAIQGKTGEVRLDCPECDGQGSQKETFHINADTGCYNCKRCGVSGNLMKGKGTGKKWADRTPEERAAWIWDTADTAVNGHEYLKAKGVPAHGLKLYKDSLVVPLGISGNLSTIQFLKPDGKKTLLGGGKKKGASFRIGSGEGRIYLCEGYATGASVYEAVGGPVYVCVDAGNLGHVGKELRRQYPDRTLVFCADNDRAKPESDKSFDVGYRKACEAARAVNGLVAMPDRKGWDFNDLHQRINAGTVADQVNAACPPPQKKTTSRTQADPDRLPKHIREFIEKEAEATGTDLDSLLQITANTIKKLRSKPTPSQAATRLAKEGGFRFELNECDDRVYCNGRPMTDVMEAQILNWADENHLNLGQDKIRNVIVGTAAENAFHPIKSYLNSLRYDGGSHIDALAGKLQSSDAPIIYPNGRQEAPHAVWLKKWLVGAVSKVFKQTQNPVLVWSGAQGKGKSKLASWLCSGIPECFIESPMTGNTKDIHKWLITKFVWEIGELDATTRKADVSLLKSLISKQVVDERFPYAKHPIVKPSCASFIGTVNDHSGFLADPTGNRRFMCVTLSSIDWSYTELDVNQIWAEAVELFRAGYDFTLSEAEKAYQHVANAGYEMESPLEGLVGKYFVNTGQSDTYLNSGDITDHLSNMGHKLPLTPATGRNLKKAVEKVFEGIEKKRGKTGWKYFGLTQHTPTGYPSNGYGVDGGVDTSSSSPLSSPLSSPIQDTDNNIKYLKGVDGEDKNGKRLKSDGNGKAVKEDGLYRFKENNKFSNYRETSSPSTPTPAECEINNSDFNSLPLGVDTSSSSPLSTPCRTCQHRNGSYCKIRRESISLERQKNGCAEWTVKMREAVHE